MTYVSRVMSSAQLYDTIGATYSVTRRTEPRIAAQVWAALGDARTVLNVGAGTGSYEPSDREVTAVEPSAVMRAQRPPGAARRVAAAAESLPCEDQSVAEYRCGPASGRTPSRGQCAASVMTSHLAGGSNATATSSISRRQSLAFACLSPEHATAGHVPARRFLPSSPSGPSGDSGDIL